MQYVLTPDKMRAADSKAINEYGIPSLVLMENAARSSAEYITGILHSFGQKVSTVLILCGSGNNGGDGFAIARHLMDKFNVRIIRIGDYLKMSPETYSNFQAIERLKIPVTHIQNESQIDSLDFSCDCLIDSLIGVGGSEEIRGIALPILKKVKDISAIKIAVDAPTGLNTQTGAASPDCFRADYTVTMYAMKTGLLINEGPEMCGKVHVAYLGAPESIVKNISDTRILGKEDIGSLIPKRKRVSSKFDYGRVLVIAGSDSFPGAAALCSNSAIISGAGLVHLMTTKLHSSLLPDVIAETVDSTQSGAIALSAYDKIKEQAEKANVILIGPGLGNDDETQEVVKKLIAELPQETTFIIDADGLRIFDKDSVLRKNIILTPHTGEFSRLTGIERNEVEKDACNLAKKWADKMNCIIHLKFVPSVTSDGKNSYWNLSGNPAMAKGGSGDVLSGIISALAARGLNSLEAAALGAFIHGYAGDIYAASHSEETLTASALTGLIEVAMKQGN